MIRRIKLVFVFFTFGTLPAICADCAARPNLNRDQLGSLLAMANGQRAIVGVDLLAVEGCGAAMVASLRSLGATIRYADERVGYAFAMIPKEKLLDLLNLVAAQEMAAQPLDTAYENYYSPPLTAPGAPRKTEPVPEISIPYPQVATVLPPGGPYFAANEAGLTALWKQHPAADGRGTRVAVADKGFDLLHPALMEALDSQGKRVPKNIDVINILGPDDDANWVPLGDAIHVRDTKFSVAGREWIAPHAGDFRFGIYDRKLYLGSGDPHVPEPHIKEPHLAVGVLLDEAGGRVWVDTDGGGDFQKHKALRDYAVAQEFDWFGKSAGDADNRIPFGVKIDAAHHRVYLSIADMAHGVVASGPLSANRLTGGLYDGAAPAAQLVDARTPSNMFHLPSMLAAFARADVDVVNRSGATNLAGPEGVTQLASHALERAIALYNKPFACACIVANALRVLDYQSAEMLRRNRQTAPPYAEAINGLYTVLLASPYNGILAPSASLLAQSRYVPAIMEWEDGRPHVTKDFLNSPAPHGYWIGSNPSPTVPVVAGILADLISEARHEHVRYDAARLTHAVQTGTRILGDFPLGAQGFGLVNAAQAWNQLKAMSEGDDPNNPKLTSFEVEAGFQRELDPAVGDNDGSVRIVRRGGYAGSRAYRLALRGDDVAFKLKQTELTLVRDQPATLRFSVQRTPGMHVALLQIVDAKAGAVMQEIPLEFRTAHEPERLGPGIERYSAVIPPLRQDVRFVALPSGVQAVRFEMNIPFTGTAITSSRSMPGLRYQQTGDRRLVPVVPEGALDAAHHVGAMEHLESLVANTDPGLKSIYWENAGRPEYGTPYDIPAPDVPVTGTLIVRQYAANFEKAGESAVRMTNRLAEVAGQVEFYSSVEESSESSPADAHGASTVSRTLPAGLSQWRVRIGATKGSPAGDAFLLDCTGKSACAIAAQAAIDDSGATLMADNPRAGSWRIVVYRRDRAGDQAHFQVRQTMLTKIASPDIPVQWKSGESRTVELPAGKNASYAAFRIAGSPGKDDQKNGLRIALTPLRESDAKKSLN